MEVLAYRPGYLNLGSLLKGGSEKPQYAIDFSEGLYGADAITAGRTVAYDASGTVVTQNCVGATAINGNQLLVSMLTCGPGGTDPAPEHARFELRTTATLAQGAIYEYKAYFLITELNVPTPIQPPAVTASTRLDVFGNRGLAANVPLQIFYATDQNYVSWVSDGVAWHWAGGENITTQSGIAAIAADLGPNDVGYILSVSDYMHRLRWTGTSFAFAPGDDGSNYVLTGNGTFAAPVGILTGTCNGSAYTYLQNDGTLGNYTTYAQDNTWFRR